MLGWEFPPYFAGGVGMVCSELAKEFSKYSNIEITYIMPYFEKDFEKIYNNFKILNSSNYKVEKLSNGLNLLKVTTSLSCYDDFNSYQKRIERTLLEIEKISHDSFKSIKKLYGNNLIQEVYNYASRIVKAIIDNNIKFDIIHAHDWTTIIAAKKLKELFHKPFILHVHITEFDKTGGNYGSERIINIEKEGFENADVIIAVSNFTKERLVKNYGVDRNKIVVIHNGGVSDIKPGKVEYKKIFNNEKIVLFAGRMTLQKGPEYFLKAAKKVLEYEDNVKFIMIGSGDMLPRMIELAAELGISKNVLFFGRYSRKDADRFFSMADVFVMPSVSEPFGIVPLEAIAKKTPTIISKQSGISEVINNVYKVDFWDINKMSEMILYLLKYKGLAKTMAENAFEEYKNLNWEKPVKKLIEIYNNLKTD
jgi:glycosyltransferase involved in cell wall biosynthesis